MDSGNVLLMQMTKMVRLIMMEQSSLKLKERSISWVGLDGGWLDGFTSLAVQPVEYFGSIQRSSSVVEEWVCTQSKDKK